MTRTVWSAPSSPKVTELIVVIVAAGAGQMYTTKSEANRTTQESKLSHGTSSWHLPARLKPKDS